MRLGRGQQGGYLRLSCSLETSTKLWGEPVDREVD